MAATYPTNIKDFGVAKVNFTTVVLAEHVNDLQDEVVAIQNALGNLPTTSSGWIGTFDSSTTTWATVKARINNIEYGVKNVYDKVGGSNVLPVANGGTGISSLGTGVATFLGTPSSANLASAITDETGSGSLVFGTSPTIATPTLTLSTTTSTAEGRIAWDGTNDQLIIGDGAATRTISPDDKAATLTNKTISVDNNTVSGIAASSFVISNASGNIDGSAAQVAIPTGTVVGTSDSQTLTNKTINGTNNTITNVSLTTGVTGTLPVANGGTGITSFGSGVATFLGTPSSANLAAAVTDETGSGALVFGTGPTITPAAGTTATATAGAGYMGMPQNSTGTGITLAATDAGKHIYVTTTGQTITIPANGTVAFPIGTTIVIVNGDLVSTTITITSDTLRLANSSSTGQRTLASNGMCTLLKVASTTWIASGNGLT